MANLLQGMTPEAPKAPAGLERDVTSVEADERAFENLPEAKETFLEREGEAPSAPTQAAPVAKAKPHAAAPPAQKDEVTIRVEKIMEEGLGDVYASLPQQAKPIFQKKGEQVAREISVMVRSLKLQIARVVRLLRDWLLTIPNVNKHFLEQEAKIKTDKLVEFVEARREELQKHP